MSMALPASRTEFCELRHAMAALSASSESSCTTTYIPAPQSSDASPSLGSLTQTMLEAFPTLVIALGDV